MKRRTNRILSILLVVLSLALLAGAGFLLVQVLPQKAPQEVTSLETNSVFEKEDAVVEPEREQAYEGEIPRRRRRSPSPTRSHLSISPSKQSLPTRASFPPRRTSVQEQHLPL